MMFQKGRRWRHCGSDCYGQPPASKRCQCICGGMNHGLGREQAILKTKASIELLIQYYHSRGLRTYWICDDVKQLDLPI